MEQAAREVWGLRHMMAECRTGRNKLEASYVQTMRELCGVRRSVPAAVLLQELGELLLALECKRQALRFGSALTALPETSIFKQAAMDDLAAAQQYNIPNWAAGLLACAKKHGMARTGADGSMMAAADEGAIAAAAAAAAALEQQEVCGHVPEDNASRRCEADDIRSSFRALAGRREASSGSWGCRRRSYALLRGSACDRTHCQWRLQVCRDRQAGPLLHVL